MSTDLQSVLSSNRQGVKRATGDYVGGMNDFEILKHLDDAATTALYSGDGNAAYTIRGVINGPDAYGQYLRNQTTMLLKDRPEILKHFSSEFTRTLLGRVS